MLITADQFLLRYPNLKGTAENTRIEQFIADADGLMAAFCGWPVNDDGVHTMVSSTYTRYLAASLRDPRVVDLPHGAVTGITSVHLDPNWLSSPGSAYGASTLIAAGSIVQDLGARELWLSNRSWYSDPRANRVVFVAGFTAEDAPPEIQAIAFAATRHLMINAPAQGNVSVTQGGSSATRSDTESLLPASVRNALTPYIVWSSRVG